MKKILFLFFIVSFSSIYSQVSLDVDGAIKMALTNSKFLEKAEKELEYTVLENSIFKKDFLPNIFTSTIFPFISKSTTKVTTPDGRDVFVNQNQAYYDLNLNIEQKEPLFGGKFTFSSYFNRIDLFGDTTEKTFFSTPFSFSYSNNSILFNSYKHEKTINTLKSRESLIGYNMRLEEIVYQTVEKYFRSYILNQNIENKVKALKEMNGIFDIAKRRFEIGSVNKGDLLSLEFNILDMESSLEDLKLEKETARKMMSLFLNKEFEPALLVRPREEIFNLNISYEEALNQMIENNKLVIELERKKAEKEFEIKKINSENKITLGLEASYGLSNTSTAFNQSIKNLNDQQSYLVSIKYLLFDFGKNKQAQKLMNIEKSILDTNFQLELEALKSDLYTLINRFRSNQKKILILKQKRNISQERYVFLKNRFTLGKVSITDLNISQKEHRQLEIEYLSTLKEIWTKYYEIRKITMFDFLNNEKINYF